LGLPIDLFPWGFPTKILYSPLFSLPIPSTCPVHLILLDLITPLIFGEEYRSRSSSLCSHLHSHDTSSLLGLNILFSILFSNTLSLCYSIKTSDQVSHPYKTAGNIVVLCILICAYTVDSKWKTKDSVLNDSKLSLTSVCS
jgi:hypothetical protein